MTTLSAHQPVYLPSVMLFNKIALSDVFIFLSHVQFVGRSWQQRNRIRGGGGEAIFLSVPVLKKGRRFQGISETEIAHDEDWRRKHLTGLRQAYGKRPYFDLYYPRLEAVLARSWTSLCDLDIALVSELAACLEITTPLLDSRDLHPEGHASEMLVSLCREVGADRYVSNVGSSAYIDAGAFAAAGVSHLWQNFRFPVYDQGAAFIDRLSVVDLLFNAGPAARSIMLAAGSLTDDLAQVADLSEPDTAAEGM
jgi:hypothetical protein